MLRGVVAPCYQHHHHGGFDCKVPQLHATQSEPLDSIKNIHFEKKGSFSVINVVETRFYYMSFLAFHYNMYLYVTFVTSNTLACDIYNNYCHWGPSTDC